jgi:hypothetical protein
MAARTVKCLFYNRTDSVVTKTSENINWGIITDPWNIPGSIAPHTVAEWRTESDGFMTGTEGFAHFSAFDGTGTNNIVAHWNNPFVGLNECSMDVTMDFTGAPSTSFKWNKAILGPVYPNLQKMTEGDIEAWIDGVLFPIYIFSNGNFAANDTTAFFLLDTASGGEKKPPPLFGGPTKKSLIDKPNTELNTAQWQGTWAADDIVVTITNLSGGQMVAHVSEFNAPSGPDIEFSESFRLWTLSPPTVHTLAIGTSKALGISPASAITAMQHASVLIGDDKNSSAPQAGSKAFSRAITAVTKNNGQTVSTAGLDKVSRGVGLAIERSKFTVTLSNGVHLMLFDQFDGSQKVGQVMHYQRNVLDNVVARRARLNYVIPLH